MVVAVAFPGPYGPGTDYDPRDNTPSGRRVVEEEAAAVRHANFEKVASWIECIRGSAASGGMQDRLLYPPESERNEAVDLEDIYPQQEESGDNQIKMFRVV